MTYVHTSGLVDTKAGYMSKVATCQLEVTEIKPASLRVFGDIAIVNGRLRLKFNDKPMGNWITYTRAYAQTAPGDVSLAHMCRTSGGQRLDASHSLW